MAPVLEVERLAKSFTGVRALDGVDLEVERGEILGLVGPNGSGKTTLFNCITSYVRPTSGRVVWEGEEITGLAFDQVARRGVVRTFQQRMLFPRVTVRENLLMAWRHRGRRDISTRSLFGNCDDLLEFLALASVHGRLAADIPFGLARNLGVGLALASNPRLLLLDEPAAGLTDEESQHLVSLIRKIRDLGVTVWVIEHNMPLIMSACDRVVVLHAGQKIAEGKPAEVANNKEVIAVYLGEKFARDQES
ncbi:MAG: ABC transporter ATP-binding protein [Dehalococcoidia bacterium]